MFAQLPQEQLASMASSSSRASRVRVGETSIQNPLFSIGRELATQIRDGKLDPSELINMEPFEINGVTVSFKFDDGKNCPALLRLEDNWGYPEESTVISDLVGHISITAP